MSTSGSSANPSIDQIIVSIQAILDELNSGAPLTDTKRTELSALLGALVSDLQGIQNGVDTLMHGP